GKGFLLADFGDDTTSTNFRHRAEAADDVDAAIIRPEGFAARTGETRLPRRHERGPGAEFRIEHRRQRQAVRVDQKCLAVLAEPGAIRKNVLDARDRNLDRKADASAFSNNDVDGRAIVVAMDRDDLSGRHLALLVPGTDQNRRTVGAIETGCGSAFNRRQRLGRPDVAGASLGRIVYGAAPLRSDVDHACEA